MHDYLQFYRDSLSRVQCHYSGVKSLASTTVLEQTFVNRPVPTHWGRTCINRWVIPHWGRTCINRPALPHWGRTCINRPVLPHWGRTCVNRPALPHWGRTCINRPVLPHWGRTCINRPALPHWGRTCVNRPALPHYNRTCVNSVKEHISIGQCHKNWTELESTLNVDSELKSTGHDCHTGANLVSRTCGMQITFILITD